MQYRFWHSLFVVLVIFGMRLDAAPAASSPASNVLVPIKIYSPKPAADNYFGAANYYSAQNRRVKIWRNSFLELVNNRLAVIDPFYNEERGAVHIFDIKTGALLNSIIGDAPGNLLGSGGLYQLSKNNFLISSPFDDEPSKGLQNNGSLRLYNHALSETTSVLRGNLSWEFLSGMDTPTAPIRDFVAISKSGKITVASPMTNGRAGKVQLLDPENLEILKTMEGSFGSQLGSGGLLSLKQNDIVVIASPLVGHSSCQGCGQITFFDPSKNEIASLYPFWGNFYVETLWSNVRLGSGEMKELSDGSVAISSLSDSAKGIRNVGSVAAVNWKARPYMDCASGSAAQNKNFHINSVHFVTGTAADDQFGWANNATGEDSISPSNGTVKIVGRNITKRFDNSLRVKSDHSAMDDQMRDKISISSDEFVFDAGDKIVIASAATGKERRSLGIKPYLVAEGPKASSFISLSQNYLGVMSSKTNDIFKSGTGAFYFVNLKSGYIEKTITQDSPTVNLGHAGMHQLSTGEILIFNPSDSSRGITNAGSIWVIPAKPF